MRDLERNNKALVRARYDATVNGFDTAAIDAQVAPNFYDHNDTYERLGIARSAVTVRLGGRACPEVKFAAGDVAVLTAGTDHKRLVASGDLLVIGGYRRGRKARQSCGRKMSTATWRNGVRPWPCRRATRSSG